MRAAAAGLSLLGLLFTVACGGTGTDLNQLVNASPFADAGDDASAAGGGAATSSDPFAGAPPYAATTGSPSHNAGQACLASGCHGSTGGGDAPSFLFGGTVYADYAGHAPAPGVEVRAMDTQGHAVSVFTGPEGNFYLRTSSAAGLSFPIAVGARSATVARPMITSLTASYGSCGQSTCHVPGGGPSTSAGAYYPIHVP